MATVCSSCIGGRAACSSIPVAQANLPRPRVCSGADGHCALPESTPTTSTITVTGTSGTLQHSTSVQITVR